MQSKEKPGAVVATGRPVLPLLMRGGYRASEESDGE